MKSKWSAFSAAILICASLTTDVTAAIYGWSISDSPTDPNINTGVPSGDIEFLYLWFWCSDEGMAAAEMTLETIPPFQVLAFIAQNGYLNAGSPTHLLLAVGGCPNAPVVAGNILVVHGEPLAVCLGGANVTVDCSANPQAWPHDRQGYADLGLPPCLSDTGFCEVFSVEESSWGTIKSLYR